MAYPNWPNTPGTWSMNPNPYQYPQPSNYPPRFQYGPSTQQPVDGLIRVTGEEGAKAYPLPPNSAIALFDANEDVFYVKTTDGAGFPTIRTFRFEEVASKIIDVEPESDYVTRGELDELKNDLVEIRRQMRDKGEVTENGQQPVSRNSSSSKHRNSQQ